MTKTKIPQRKVKDWNDFNEIINRLDIIVPPKIGCIYRGHSDESWKLKPSFHRHFEPWPLPKYEALLKIERIALGQFRRQAHLHVSSNVINKLTTVLDWWMLMQHHNAPTRLLDWTRSPYVAAYHACEKDFDKDGVVWIVVGSALHKKMKTIYKVDSVPPKNISDSFFLGPDETSEVFFVNPHFETDRMVAQQGLFTVCRNISGNQHEIILNAFGTKETSFLKLIIPSIQKTDFLKKQCAMNITAGSLFPGLDGLGRSVKELVHLNAFKEKEEFEKKLVPKIGGFFKTDDAARDQKDT